MDMSSGKGGTSELSRLGPDPGPLPSDGSADVVARGAGAGVNGMIVSSL